MSVIFNADEIFEMAEQVERNGAQFYRRAVEITDDSTVRDNLMRLAEMEDQHEITFASMRVEFSSGERSETVFDPDNQIQLYLRAMADGHVFDTQSDPSEKLSGEVSLEEIVQTAIGLEKDSIIFYLGLRDMVPKNLGKDKINDIIKEEMGHITDLSEQLRALKT